MKLLFVLFRQKLNLFFKKMNNKIEKALKLLISIALPFLAAAIGSVFTASSVDSWYQTLQKPFLNPPNWIFGPVWTLLFFLIGCSLYLVWQSDKEGKRKAYLIFSIQLVLNVLWSALFFGLQNPGFAFAEIIILWIFIIWNIVIFRKFSSVATWLLVPYLLWVSFAAYLNFSIFRLN